MSDKTILKTGTIGTAKGMFQYQVQPTKMIDVFLVEIFAINVNLKKVENIETRTLKSEVQRQRPIKDPSITANEYQEIVNEYQKNPKKYSGDLETFIETITQVKDVPVITEVKTSNSKSVGSMEIFTMLPRNYLTKSVKNFIDYKIK